MSVPRINVHCRVALVDGVEVRDLRIAVDDDGLIAGLTAGVDAQAGDLQLEVALPGSVNAHSHAFHRLLRGRTHADGGDFWQWRDRMYRAAAGLEPDSYRRLAAAVFAEMLTAGWTSVAEFHYVHHRVDGSFYSEPNAMGLALVDAAEEVGIRLTLLDTCYLSSAPGEALTPAQARFGDGDVQRWADRWHALRESVGSRAVVGAAVHSLRAMNPTQVRELVDRIPSDVPLHLHLSEQTNENIAVHGAYGASPTRVLHDLGVLDARLSVVHATHLSPDDIEKLGSAGVTAVFCPTTETDLGDGIGPARALADAGARLALGSDQNAVIDPWHEARALEYGERLSTRTRGRFSPAELERARATDASAAVGRPCGLVIGAPADLVELDARSSRTVGSAIAQLAFTATSADVRRVVVGGRIVAERELLADGRSPARMLAEAIDDAEKLHR